jgi:hypothetical protein
VRSPRILVTVALAAVLATTGCGAFARGTPQLNASQAAVLLNQLTVAPAQSMAGYSRARFPHWDNQASGCDTRAVVLKRDGTGVRADNECRIIAGRWHSAYDSVDVLDPQQVDVDHLVPLANAWRSGANSWTDLHREEFANDLDRPQLIAVSAKANRAKGDQDPSQWRPANRNFWCPYAQRWIQVKEYYHLTVTEREKASLGEMLGTCQWPSSSASSS